jgi:hypothetical protein
MKQSRLLAEGAVAKQVLELARERSTFCGVSHRESHVDLLRRRGDHCWNIGRLRRGLFGGIGARVTSFGP